MNGDADASPFMHVSVLPGDPRHTHATQSHMLFTMRCLVLPLGGSVLLSRHLRTNGSALLS